MTQPRAHLIYGVPTLCWTLGIKRPERYSLCPQGVYYQPGRQVTEELRVSQGAGEGRWRAKQGVNWRVWSKDGGEGEGPSRRGCGKDITELPRGWRLSRHAGRVPIKTSLARWWHSSLRSQNNCDKNNFGLILRCLLKLKGGSPHDIYFAR